MGLGVKTWVLNLVNRAFPPKDPSLHGLSQKLLKYLDFDNGVFVEVGGNDGYTQSNTYFYAKTRGWKGVLVEPIPNLCEKCKKRRPESSVFGCALVSSEFSDATVKIRYANLMSTVEGALGESEASHLSDAEQFLDQGENQYTVEVPARTLESVLDEAGYSEIDFLSLDVEGFEVEVLDGLNLGKYSPSYILIEVRDLEGIERALGGRYKMIEKMSHHDYLFKRV